MEFGMKKDNKFEIVAIIREELLKRTKLELRCKEITIVTQLEKVDFNYFVIAHNAASPPSLLQSFILHSEGGIIKFKARYNQILTDKLECGLVYYIPEVIFFVQRRAHQRFYFLKEFKFYCFGRYRNGENYTLQIKNISRGGCALISLDVNTRFLYKNALIKGTTLGFEEFGSLNVDLRVVDIIPTSEFDENNQLFTCYQISCKFEFKHSREESDVERIIIRFLMRNKLKNF